MADPAEYADRYLGRDIYVLGSGPSLNYFPSGFFEGRIVVSANHGCTKAGIAPTQMVTKYHRHAIDYLTQFPGVPVVTTRHESGQHHQRVIEDDRLIIVDTNDNTCEHWTPAQWPLEGQLVATWSTITTAMHWAAHLGARNIIMVGHDCGWIDAAGRVPGYRQAADGVTDDDGDSFMWQAFDAQSRQVKQQLVERYGVTVTSMLPFINANMEGHRWRSFAGTLNQEAP